MNTQTIINWISWFNQDKNRIKFFNKEIGKNINYKLIPIWYNQAKTLFAIIGLIALILISVSSMVFGYPFGENGVDFPALITIKHTLDLDVLNQSIKLFIEAWR